MTMSMNLYKKIDKLSGESIPDNLNFFSTPLTQVAIEKTYEREFITLNPVNEAPFSFGVQTGSSCIDPHKTRVVTTWKMMKKLTGEKDWVNVESDDEINVINGVGAAFIKNFKLMCNGQKLFDSNMMYSYLVHFTNELRFSEDSKKSSMNAFGYYYDNGPKDYDTTKTYLKTDAWKNRRDLFTDGKIVEFSAPLYADIFQQPLLLPSNLNFNFEFNPHPSDYLVLAPTFTGGEIMLKMESIRLFVTFVDLHPGVSLEIEKKLATENIKIPIRRTEMRTLFYDQQRLENHSVAFTDFVPREMDIAFIPRKNWVNDPKTDPKYCHHAFASELQVKVGNNSIPHVPFVMDFE